MKQDNLQITDVSNVEGQMRSIDINEIPQLAVDLVRLSLIHI